MNDFNLNRFKEAQSHIFDSVLDELGQGQKYGHWMWFIFPQIDGLAESTQSRFYSIKSRNEALAYWQNDLLRNRYLKCLRALEQQSEFSAEVIFGFPDYLKFHSSLTLFAQVTGDGEVIENLNRFFSGNLDAPTLKILDLIE